MRLFRCCSLVIVAFALLILAAQGIGRAQPPPERLAGLHLTECALPCWNGITLGTTMMGEAFRRITDEYGQASQTFFADEAVINARYQTTAIDGFLETYVDARGVVQTVRLVFREDAGLRLGDVVNLIGAPAEVVGTPPDTVVFQCASSTIFVATFGSDGWYNLLGVLSIAYNANNSAKPCALEIE